MFYPLIIFILFTIIGYREKFSLFQYIVSFCDNHFCLLIGLMVVIVPLMIQLFHYFIVYIWHG
jgi:hypothetical protein